MKINLLFPYSDDWKHGYLQVNGENRKTVILYNSPSDRSSTAYSRYLMSTKIGRYLNEYEHVDHIDNDKTNDDISNLQILTNKENNIKEGLRRRKVRVKLKCSYCGEEFEREPRQMHKGNTKFYCTRRCAYDSMRK